MSDRQRTVSDDQGIGDHSSNCKEVIWSGDFGAMVALYCNYKFQLLCSTRKNDSFGPEGKRESRHNHVDELRDKIKQLCDAMQVRLAVLYSTRQWLETTHAQLIKVRNRVASEVNACRRKNTRDQFAVLLGELNESIALLDELSDSTVRS
ncbi:MAG: hypothetical protein UX68_C0014G0011 [Parcubacteria group bacterium GW2011_GWA2_46_9]|nr:MAG: hypothetical protein UX68_C0014G0011 [Parcubacteria group bacterium GW2011_GWA2_46_9]